MTTRGLLYAVDCDICETRFGTGENQFRLRDQAHAAGWRFRRRKDGEIAIRGGNDYCPACAASTFPAVAPC